VKFFFVIHFALSPPPHFPHFPSFKGNLVRCLVSVFQRRCLSLLNSWFVVSPPGFPILPLRLTTPKMPLTFSFSSNIPKFLSLSQRRNAPTFLVSQEPKTPLSPSPNSHSRMASPTSISYPYVKLPHSIHHWLCSQGQVSLPCFL